MIPVVNDPDPWPATAESLVAEQEAIACIHPDLWIPAEPLNSAAGCWICHPKGQVGPGSTGDICWAAAALIIDLRVAATAVVQGRAHAPYLPGLLALREGSLLEQVVRALPETPEVLLVNATGRDHPRRAGLATHLGVRLGLPTIGVTRRPLVAECALPADSRGSRAALTIGTEVVGYWLRTKPGAPPIAVHSAWRTDPDTAAAVVMAVTGRWRTPEPLRHARRTAREARARGGY